MSTVALDGCPFRQPSGLCGQPTMPHCRSSSRPPVTARQDTCYVAAFGTQQSPHGKRPACDSAASRASGCSVIERHEQRIGAGRLPRPTPRPVCQGSRPGHHLLTVAIASSVASFGQDGAGWRKATDAAGRRIGMEIFRTHIHPLSRR